MSKKRKSYYNNQKNSKKTKFMFTDSIKLGKDMQGFLITYNCKFTFIINESKKLLQQFLPSPAEKTQNEIKNDDLEKQLQQELMILNQADKKFNVLDTGAKYTIFINLNDVNPNLVVESIFEHIENSKKPLGRYVQRLLPILNTCKAYPEDIDKCLTSTLDSIEVIKESNSKCNEPKPFKYCCIFKSSNNNCISRDDIIKIVGNYIQGKNTQNKVDFVDPDYVILINIICNICYLSFVKNFFKYRKYNLIEMGLKFGVSDNNKVVLNNNNNNMNMNTNNTNNEDTLNKIVD